MSLYGGWVAYGGGARIGLAAGFLVAAGCVAYGGYRLKRPLQPEHPARSVIVLMFSFWVGSLILFLVGLAFYIKQFVHDYPHMSGTAHNPITPITLSAALVTAIIVMTRTGWYYPTRLGSAIVAAMAAPMFFEFPFNLAVLSRTYPPVPPDPALYRAAFFTPLILIEFTTIWLLTLSPMVKLRRSTLYCFALMLGVFAIWALFGYAYPATPAPLTLNIVSKLLCFVTALTLFVPDRLRDWRTEGRKGPRNPQARPAVATPSAGVMAPPAPVLAAASPAAAAPAPPAGVFSPPPRAATTVSTPAQLPRERIMGGPAITVTGLRKSFGDKEAVAGIDLEIAAGSFAGLVGPNGAGKTTSLSMMTGLLRPDAGQIVVDGYDVWADPPAAKAIMGVVPAEARLFERLSGEEMLEYAGRLRGLAVDEARSRATQLLEVLDLTADAKRLVADYSTGMRKKTALGCALIHNPAVLFLDEPLEGVDPVSADAIRQMLTRYVSSGSTVLFSSHVMELVEQVCDHVSIISQGHIVASGTIDEVRGGKTLQRAFIDLVGSRASEEGLSWLGSSSS
jgi:ABC-2 type transport system ATP-binding protein